MEYISGAIIGVTAKSPSPSGGGYQIFSEIVIIDQSQKQLGPLLYQLRRELTPHEFSRRVKGLVHLPKNSFMMMGEVAAVDRVQRIIHLTNGNRISYRYLIVTSDLDSEKASDSITLQTLVDALNTHRSLASGVSHFQETFFQKVQDQINRKVLNDHDRKLWQGICDIATKRMPEKSKDPLPSLSETASSLQEIQI